jgi:hypothetical protein
VRASALTDGLWVAEFAGWRVQLDGHDGQWSADLRWVSPLRPPSGKKVPVLRETGFASPAEAFVWAAQQFPGMMVLGAPEGFTVESFLSFQPVLSAVP